MTLFKIAGDKVELIKETTFAEENIKERGDLQRMLLHNIGVISENLMVITEEFGEWDDCKRRIDILAIDSDANLVVIELKRTQDGGHMELQAIRYAAMISTLTFEQVVQIHEKFLKNRGKDNDARASILEFLEWNEVDEEQFASDVRIILAAADFSKEITSTVLWLNSRDLDITCMRVKPYKLGEQIVLDVQQLIPLPEAEEYQVKVREKDKLKRSKRWVQKPLSEIWRELEEKCTAEEFQTAKEIDDWLQTRVTEVFPTANAFAPLLRVKNRDQFFFKVTTDGSVQLWFLYLANKLPFSDESLRRQLLEKINLIPGVKIEETRINGKPSFPIKLLVNKDSLQKFKDTFEWVFSVMETEGKQ